MTTGLMGYVVDYERPRGHEPRMPALRLLWRGGYHSKGPTVRYQSEEDAVRVAMGLPDARVWEVDEFGYMKREVVWWV